MDYITPTPSFNSKTGCRVVACPTQQITWILHFKLKICFFFDKIAESDT